MANAPENELAKLSIRAPQFAVLVGAAGDANPPTPDDEVTFLRPLKIVRSAGGGQLDHAVFEYDLGQTGEQLVDVQVQVDWNRKVEVRLVDPETGEPNGALLFAGETTQQSLKLDEKAEKVTITAALAPYHFGSIVEGPEYWEPVLDQAITVHDDLIFNPLIDGKIEPDATDKGGLDYFLWIDPESLRSDGAREFQEVAGQDTFGWTLASAIKSLCAIANADETEVANPQDLGTNPIFDVAPEINNLRLPPGHYLPDLLDALLEPHGYGWSVGYSLDENDEATRAIKIHNRGSGLLKSVDVQAPGEKLDPSLSNAPASLVETNIADLANEIVGLGAREEREMTIELKRNWDAALDDQFGPDDLKKSDPDSSFAANRNVWRSWIANEAGDLDGNPIDFINQFSAGYLHRRRKLEETLTYDENGKRRPPVIEWWDPATEEWREVKSWGQTVMEDQIGVYFDGDTPPEELMHLGEDARLRVTGTVAGDQRLKATAVKDATSPNGNTVALQLDVADRFFDREIVTTGQYASALQDEPHGSAERDDELALQEYVDNVQKIEKAIGLVSKFALHGLSLDYQVGDLIEKIHGRNVSLNRFAPDAETKRYPQIVAVTWDFQAQKTVLTLDTPEPTL